MEAPAYGPFKELLGALMEGVHLHHVQMEPPSLISRAPVVEFATFFAPQEGFLDNVEKFAEAFRQGKPSGFYGCAWGKVIEKIVKHKDVDNEGVQKSDAVVILVG